MSGSLFALIGDPVEHSVSPQMFNEAFRHLGLHSHLYVGLRITPRELGQFAAAVRLLGIRGFNVTIPHKQRVMSHLDSLDRGASRVQAVNVVDNRRGKLKGFNTDVTAIMKLLKPHVHASDRAVVLGCGGAARAAAIALLELNCSEQAFVGRRLKTLKPMARFAKQRGIDASTLKFGSDELKRCISSADILVNATPVGMYPNINRTPIDREIIPKHAVVFDMVYNPAETRLLRNAKARGNRVVGGLDMLVTQAAEAFRIWFSENPPIEVMRRAARRSLEEFRG